MALLNLWSQNMSSGNPSSQTSILPGGAGGNAVAGTTTIPMLGVPTLEPIARMVNDQTPAYIDANGAQQGNLVVLGYGLPAGITSNVGGGYWQQSQAYARAHAPLAYGIVNVCPGLGIGQQVEVICNGPIQALCTTTTNAIAVGTLLCADGLGNLTSFQPPSGAPTPTITPVGTSGSTTYTYALVAVGANGTTSVIGTTASTVAGNATLSNTNYNQITWVPGGDAASYIIVRTSSAGTPSTVGVIGYATSTDTAFNDTGLAIVPNTSATQFFQRLAAPSTPTVTTSGTAGTTSYSYKITAVLPNGVYSAESTAGTVSTGNATLGAVNYNHITWSAVTGATLYVIDRTASAGVPSTLGTIGYFSVVPGSSPTYAFNDTGLAATTYTAVTTPTISPPAGTTLAISLGVVAASTSTPVLNPVWVGGF
jgi:hypothetical protein